jgi:hypothetical protein
MVSHIAVEARRRQHTLFDVGTAVAKTSAAMNEASGQSRFDDLPPAEQHDVETYIDQISRRDTVIEDCVAESRFEPVTESLIYAIPSAELDRRSAMRLLQAGTDGTLGGCLY